MLVRISSLKENLKKNLNKQSDLGLPCLSRDLWLATSV